jgi:hypothetical protein
MRKCIDTRLSRWDEVKSISRWRVHFRSCWRLRSNSSAGSQPFGGCYLCASSISLRCMAIQTEQIGSIPRPLSLLRAVTAFQANQIGADALEEEYTKALEDTIKRLELTGSSVITDGEQTKPASPLTRSRGLIISRRMESSFRLRTAIRASCHA